MIGQQVVLVQHTQVFMEREVACPKPLLNPELPGGQVSHLTQPQSPTDAIGGC